MPRPILLLLIACAVCLVGLIVGRLVSEGDIRGGQGVLVVREEGSCESRSSEEIFELSRSGKLEDLLHAKRVLKVSKHMLCYIVLV